MELPLPAAFLVGILIGLKLCLCNKIQNILENNPDLEKLVEYAKSNKASWQESMENSTDFTLQDVNSTSPNKSSIGLQVITKKWLVRNFYLYTRDFRKGTKYEVIDPRNITSIKSSHFHSRQTYIIIHGFIGFGLEDWILSLKDKLLAKEDCNVIAVDWPAGISWILPTYIAAASKVPYIGDNAAVLLYALITYKGLLLEQVHCIGHSLGGHVCGFMGKPFQGRVGRIAALDPAGPLFHKVNATKRLDKKDAIYVDVMHTNACDWDYWMDCYGIDEDIGHSDFYPNGGEHQPACAVLLPGFLKGEIGCNHQMAYMYYMESLNYDPNDTFFLARPCDNWFTFTIGNCSCGNAPQYMGFNVNSELEGEFYLETNAYQPYAQEDPKCSGTRAWNFLIIIGYVLAAGIVLSCLVTSLIITTKNVQRCLRSPSRDGGSDDSGNLVNNSDGESEESGVVVS